MKVVMNDGSRFDIGGLKAVRDGVVLFEDEERENTVGFVPSDQFQYILPESVIDQLEESRQGTRTQQPDESTHTGEPAHRTTGREQGLAGSVQPAQGQQGFGHQQPGQAQQQAAQFGQSQQVPGQTAQRQQRTDPSGQREEQRRQQERPIQ